jgi:hypothetical protein
MSGEPVNRPKRGRKYNAKQATKPEDNQAYMCSYTDYRRFQHQFAHTMRTSSPAGVVSGSQHTATKRPAWEEEAKREPLSVGLWGEPATGMQKYRAPARRKRISASNGGLQSCRGKRIAYHIDHKQVASRTATMGSHKQNQERNQSENEKEASHASDHDESWAPCSWDLLKQAPQRLSPNPRFTCNSVQIGGESSADP